MDVIQKQHRKKARRGDVMLAMARYTIHTTVCGTYLVGKYPFPLTQILFLAGLQVMKLYLYRENFILLPHQKKWNKKLNKSLIH